MIRNAWRALLIVGVGATLARGADPTEAVTIRGIRPDQQLERLIALFHGTRSPHPAAALSAWKRASREPNKLGKPLEAVIAMLNPDMVRELRALDEARVGLGLDADDGHIRWYAVAPHDDGSFAALVTAFVLTDGGSDPPMLGVEVDRLGPPGSPVSARVPGVLTLAGSREDLPSALRQANADVAVRPDVDSGWVVRLDPSRLVPAGSIPRRRAVEAIRALGMADAEAICGLHGDAATLVVSARVDEAPAESSTLEPSWLDWVPATGTVAAWAIAIDANPRAWESVFAWADRVERVDPARAEVAPLRTRLNLFAAAAGVLPEVDLWPQLRGVSGFLRANAEGRVDGTLLALHAADENAAERLAGRFIPRVAAALMKGAKPVKGSDGVEQLGSYMGRPLSATRRGATVLAAWGDATLEAALTAREHPEHSAGATIRAPWEKKPLRRAGAFWPGRLGTPILTDAPPVLWWGRDEGATTSDIVRWSGLHDLVRRALDRLPLDPPPDH